MNYSYHFDPVKGKRVTCHKSIVLFKKILSFRVTAYKTLFIKRSAETIFQKQKKQE